MSKKNKAKRAIAEVRNAAAASAYNKRTINYFDSGQTFIQGFWAGIQYALDNMQAKVELQYCSECGPVPTRIGRYANACPSRWC